VSFPRRTLMRLGNVPLNQQRRTLLLNLKERHAVSKMPDRLLRVRNTRSRQHATATVAAMQQFGTPEICRIVTIVPSSNPRRCPQLLQRVQAGQEDEERDRRAVVSLTDGARVFVQGAGFCPRDILRFQEQIRTNGYVHCTKSSTYVHFNRVLAQPC
jgi:hypothetical protein